MIVNGYEIKPGADLRGAGLYGADLYRADLRRADLYGADLYRANLRGADLGGADLNETNLRRADLRGANLRGANLREADLREAHLGGADLRWANLCRASLRRADLRGAILPHFQIPREGELIVWKKTEKGLVKLRIPPDAKRTASLIGRKCRAEFAEVLEAPPDARSYQDPDFRYERGRIVRPDRYNDDIRVECAHGIHFFLTREEAEEYQA